MERIQFNTGRYYSEHGQRIVAVKHNDVIFFNDIDRGIDGMFSALDDMFGPVELCQAIVMSQYDSGAYNWPKMTKEVEQALVWIEQ